MVDHMGILGAEFQFVRSHRLLPQESLYQFIGLNTNFGGISSMKARAPIGGFDGSGLYQASTQTSPTLDSLCSRSGLGPSVFVIKVPYSLTLPTYNTSSSPILLHSPPTS